MMEPSEICVFYSQSYALVTGVTGFVGKAIVEKLLRSCSDIPAVYVLMRPKTGRSIQQRLLELISNSVFDTLRVQNAQVLSKIIPIGGDITITGLGLSLEDEKTLCDNVGIVIHSAATIRFNETLKESIKTNLYGTQRIVELARKMKKLKAFVHISTAYSNCERREIKEVVYPPPIGNQKLSEIIERINEPMTRGVGSISIGPKKNPYLFTKALTENFLNQNCTDLPLCIVRPSCVGSAFREPNRGWIDNNNGLSGLLIGVSYGVLRVLVCNNQKVADIIPVDLVANTTIVAAWQTAKAESKDLTVYNCCSGSLNPLFFGDLFKSLLKYIKKAPPTGVIWCPNLTCYNSWFWIVVPNFIQHYAPAHLMDGFLKTVYRKPRMVKIYEKMRKMREVLEPFGTLDWKFACDNVSTLHSLMSPVDKELFPIDVKRVVWNDYIKSYWHGLRTYVLKEDPSTIPAAKCTLQRKLVLQRRVQVGFILLILTAIISVSLVIHLWRAHKTHIESVTPYVQPNVWKLSIADIKGSKSTLPALGLQAPAHCYANLSTGTYKDTADYCYCMTVGGSDNENTKRTRMH